MHPALAPGRTAVITGAASGIGLATAQRLAALGMRLCLADIDEAGLASAAQSMPGADILTLRTDVSQRGDVERLHSQALARFGEVGLLMNNAGREGGGALSAGPERWAAILDTNLWGVINGVQAFTPAHGGGRERPVRDHQHRVQAGHHHAARQHRLQRQQGGHQGRLRRAWRTTCGRHGASVTAHLLIPGFTFTGFTRVRTDIRPAGRLDRRSRWWTSCWPALARGRLLHPVPGQRHDPGAGREADSLGRWRTWLENRPALCPAGTRTTSTPSPGTWPDDGRRRYGAGPDECRRKHRAGRDEGRGKHSAGPGEGRPQP